MIYLISMDFYRGVSFLTVLALEEFAYRMHVIPCTLDRREQSGQPAEDSRQKEESFTICCPAPHDWKVSVAKYAVSPDKILPSPYFLFASLMIV